MANETQSPVPANITTAEQFAAKREEKANQPPSHEAFTDIADKAKRLQAINDYLKQNHLKSLGTVGNAEDSKSGVEFGRIIEDKVVRDPKRIYYHVIKFDSTFKGGTKGEYSIIFKENGDVADGTVVVARINTADGETRYVLVNQYRPVQGERMNELPRGFADMGDKNPTTQQFNKPVNIADLPGLGGLRELQEETGIEKVKSVTSLGQLAEDSSLVASRVNIVLVDADSSLGAQKLDTAEATMQVVFKSPEEMWGGVKKGEVIDMHSASALLLAACKDKQAAQELAQILVKEHSLPATNLQRAA